MTNKQPPQIEQQKPKEQNQFKSNADNRPSDSVIDERYILGRRLGQGSMGAVYEVQHTRLNKRFAMKILHPQLAKDKPGVARFHREASALSRLDHPNCVGVIDFGHTQKGDLYIVMDLVDGVPLSRLLGSGGPLPTHEAMEITRQVLRGLHHAHNAGIIHRDIKLGNLMKIDNEDGSFTIKILDFGIAKLDGTNKGKDPGSTVTAAGVVLGTPQYIAPETILNQEINQKTDLYAVGVLLFMLLVGKLPFFGNDVESIVRSKVNSPTPRLNEFGDGAFPQVLEDFLDTALASPSKRFESATGMLESLDRVEEELSKTEQTDKIPLPSRLGKIHSAALEKASQVKAYGLDRGKTLGRLLRSDFRAWRESQPEMSGNLWVARSVGLFTTSHGRHLLSTLLVAMFLVGFVITWGTSSQSAPPLETGMLHLNVEQTPASAELPPTPAQPAEEEKVMEFDSFEVEYAMQAEALLVEKKCRRAKQLLLPAATQNPESAHAHFLLGHTHMCLGETLKGIASYRSAISLNDHYRSKKSILSEVKKLTHQPQMQVWAVDFMANEIGPPALAALIEIAEKHPNRQLRHLALNYVSKAGAEARLNHEKRLALDARQAKSCTQKAKIVDEIADLGTTEAQDVLRQLKDATTSDYFGRKSHAHACVRPQIKKRLAAMNKDFVVVAGSE